MSHARLSDSQDTEIETIDTSYNFNDKTDEWEDGKSDWESLEIR
jgi:hypothetical protein